MKVILNLILYFGLFCSATQVVSESESQVFNKKVIAGWENLKWNVPPSDNMQEIDPLGMYRAYELKDQDLTKFNLKSDLVSYLFKDDKFKGLKIVWGFNKKLTEKQYRNLLKQLSLAFGNPNKKTVIESYHWTVEKENIEASFSIINLVGAKKDGYVVSFTIFNRK